MLKTDAEKDICQKWSAPGSGYGSHCKDCPLAIDPDKCLCKANAHWNPVTNEWEWDEGKETEVNCISPVEFDAIKNTVQNVFADEVKIPAQPKNKKVHRHFEICQELNNLYARKNHDYGDSFHKTFLEEGWAMVRIRLSDKLQRIKTLTKNNEQQVSDESLRDTFRDLANYSIMAMMEMEEKNENGNSESNA